MKQVGLQLWSVRDSMSEDLLGTLEKVAAMGYGGVQFAGFGDHPAAEVKAKLDELGLKVMGAHVQFPDLQNNFQATVDYHKALGNDLIIVPSIDDSLRESAETYQKTASMLDELGKRLAEQDMTLGYHNHDFEFDVFDGTTGHDIIFTETDPAHLQMELDCFWAAYTDNDPLAIIEKYNTRCASLHIKDMDADQSEPVSIELGTGTLPLIEYMQKGKDVGVTWFIVEQEHFTGDPMAIAEQNAHYMKEAVTKLT